MSDPLDVSGVWYGLYVSHSDPQENRFIAVLEEFAGAVSGTISEPDGAGGIRRAAVAGQRTGPALHFVKQYIGAWTHAVHYAGRIDGEGVVIDGSWSLDRLRGSFEMQREKFDAARLEHEAVEEIVDPIEVR